MSRPTPALAIAVLLAVAGAVGCGGGEPARLTRLDASLGPLVSVRLPPAGIGTAPQELGGHPNVTRTALALRPGETRTTTLVLHRKSRLAFATGLSAVPSRGEVRLVVEVNGRRAWSAALGQDAAYHWSPVTIPLPAAARATLTLRADRGTAAFAEGAAPLVLLGSPRLEAGRTLAPRRVLVWISIDTLRADHLGLYGRKDRVTPVLDALGAESTVFDDAVATAPWTLPSMASQFTSRLPSFHGAVTVTARRDPRFPSIFELLARDGFTVLGVTGNRYIAPDFGMADGFDVLDFTPDDAAKVTKLAERIRADWSAGDLALFVHYMDPHHPYHAPQAWNRRFVRADYSGPARGDNFFKLPADAVGPADVQHVRDLYDAEVAYTDDRVGALLDALRRRGLLDHAVVVVSSDHGEAFLDHGRWLHGHTLYEELLHVPLILKAPGLVPRRVAQPVSLADLAPTLIELLGLPRPPSFQGRSLVALLQGGSIPPAPIFAETDIGGGGRFRKVAVRLGRLKLLGHSVAYEHWALSQRGLELFDLEQDPLEREPLPEPGGSPLVREASGYLARADSEGATELPADVAPEALEALRALGYVQ